MTAACAHCGLPVAPGRAAATASATAFCCFGCRLAAELARPGALASGADGARASTLELRLGLGGFLAMNIMVFSWLGYARELLAEGLVSSAQEQVLASLFSYLLLLLTTVVVASLGAPLLLDVLFDGLGRFRVRLEANLLIAIGVAAAYALSVVHTLRGEGPLYYDTAAVLLVLVTLGSWLESSARQRSMRAAEGLLADLPSRATVVREGQAVEVEAGAVCCGDLLLVRPGEAIAADGVVVEGRAQLDEASLTGESLPRAVAAGDRVLAGTLSRDGQLRVQVRAVGAERVIARTRELLLAARREQPSIQRAADRAAALFVPGVLSLALAVFAVHALSGDVLTGLFDGLSVLLISCPCALGLAAPLATHFALHRAARLGLLIDSGATLERAAAVRHVFFDKTGTLTDGRLELRGIVCAEGCEPNRELATAAALESASRHPLASALAVGAREILDKVGLAEDALTLPGLGIEGTVDGRRFRLGSRRLVEERGLPLPALLATGAATIPIWLMDDERVRARLDFAEEPREDAGETVARLRTMGVESSILSGDSEAAAARVGGQLGIGVRAGLLPADKVVALAAERRRTGTSVAMVGDGINDAPVLAVADVGFVLGGGAELAREAGHVLVLGDRLRRIPDALALARHARLCIRLALLWAFAYNVVGIGLAAAGRLTPLFAAAAMLGSSLLVLATAREAGRIRTAGRGERLP